MKFEQWIDRKVETFGVGFGWYLTKQGGHGHMSGRHTDPKPRSNQQQNHDHDQGNEFGKRNLITHTLLS